MSSEPMSTPKPPAATPSATTRCAWCDRQLPLGAWTYCSADCKQEAWLHSIVPPASAPAATAETEPRPAATDYACPECHGDTVLADRRDAVGICSRCGWFGPVGDAAPTGEEAETTERYRQIAFSLNDTTLNGEPVSVNQVRCITAALEAAQATELAALRSENERLRAPAMCGVCGGRGIPVSGKPCICGGIGTEQAEMDGLRKACFDYEDELAALRARVEENATLLERMSLIRDVCRRNGFPTARLTIEEMDLICAALASTERPA